MEALDPQRNGKTSPPTNTVPGTLPKEDGYSSSSNASNRGSQDKHATQSLTGGVDCGEHTELEDKHKANQGQGVKSD